MIKIFINSNYINKMKLIETSNYWIYNNILIIKCEFDEDITTIDIDNNIITQLFFTNYDDIEYTIESINNNLDGYETYSKFNYPIDNLLNKWLPKNVNCLTFGYSFNQTVDNLPRMITHLNFGWNFNQTVDNLPHIITHLKFGENFNQTVDNLPHMITHLIFGGYFNQSVDNLPNSIIEIFFSQWVNAKFQNLLNCLPNSIEKITLNPNYKLPIKYIPKNLKQIM